MMARCCALDTGVLFLQMDAYLEAGVVHINIIYMSLCILIVLLPEYCLQFYRTAA